MAIESLGGVSSVTSSALEQAGLGQEDFLKVLLTQLTFQDPLEPLDNQEFIAQIAEFTSLEQAQQTNEKMDTLLTLESANQALGLLNKTVEVNTSSGTEVGEVTTITFDQGVPVITVKKSNNEFITGVSLAQISLIR